MDAVGLLLSSGHTMLIIVLLGDQVYCIKCGELNENTPKRYSKPGVRYQGV